MQLAGEDLHNLQWERVLLSNHKDYQLSSSEIFMYIKKGIREHFWCFRYIFLCSLHLDL